MLDKIAYIYILIHICIELRTRETTYIPTLRHIRVFIIIGFLLADIYEIFRLYRDVQVHVVAYMYIHMYIEY